jgi:asparagine synthase (glutamine-hydrolysing)
VIDKITTGLLFDESTLYQFLRVGFALGNRTMFHDIDRMKYSSAVLINQDKIEFRHNPIDLEEMEGTLHGKNKLDQLYEFYKEAVSVRMQQNEKTVVSLSGGLDSRLVMGELEKNGFKADYSTFFYDNPIISNDVKIARDLGKLYNRTAEVTDLTEWKPESFDELTTAKGGMNYMGMGFILRFLIQLGHNYDLMLTGDGGDKTLAFLFPDKKIKPAKLSKYILKNHSVSSRKTLDSFLLTDVKEQDQLILDHLDKLSGKDANFKYKNFLFFERARHWLFEGEDRNRSYLWSTSPFYQPGFFRLVHSLPEKEKKNFRLYRQFTDKVDLKLNAIVNANWNIPLSDAKGVDRMLYRQKLKSKLSFLKGANGGQLASHAEMAVLVAALMHKGYGGQIAVNADRHDLNAASSETLFHLITLLKVSEMTWKNS